jgi:hypothetical protein
MDEYIKREDVISAMCFGCNQQFSDEPCEPNECALRQAIKAVSTADVVEVVRCKDCRHKNPNCNKCLRDNLWHDSDDFCSYGERKE